MKRILFLCTGNYYRSRLAEELFNAFAKEASLPWFADSCALALERGFANVGPISPHTKSALQALDIKLKDPVRHPRTAGKEDFEKAHRVIALYEVEHRPLMESRHPDWKHKVEYWNVGDVQDAPPTEAVMQIEEAVRALIQELLAPVPTS